MFWTLSENIVTLPFYQRCQANFFEVRIWKIRKFSGSFRLRKFANFLGPPVRKSEIRKSEIRKFYKILHNSVSKQS